MLGTRIDLVGHSLGGGLATLCALDLRRSVRNQVRLITFGGPRVGNGAFRDCFRAHDPLDAETARFINIADPVPRVPPYLAHSPTFGFCHVCAATALDGGGEASEAAADADRVVERAVWPRAGDDAPVLFGPGTVNGVPPPPPPVAPSAAPSQGPTERAAAAPVAPSAQSATAPENLVGRVSAGLRSATRALTLPERAVRAHMLEATYAPNARACVEGARPSTRAIPTLVRL
jgi:pimeloyl-ACP methyl ester carboxylesterase